MRSLAELNLGKRSASQNYVIRKLKIYNEGFSALNKKDKYEVTAIYLDSMDKVAEKNIGVDLPSQFLSKIRGLNSKVIEKLNDLEGRTVLDNVRGIINGLIGNLEKENKALAGIGSDQMIERLKSLERVESRGVYDHINQPFNINAGIEENDLGGVLDFMLSFLNYKISMFSLWSKEYSGSRVEKVFSGLVNIEEENKRKIEVMIDTFVHKDW
ncbi:MAG: hypothetical protein QXN59_00200 [Candidatus Micrarchaeaceae archaeon]